MNLIQMMNLEYYFLHQLLKVFHSIHFVFIKSNWIFFYLICVLDVLIRKSFMSQFSHIYNLKDHRLNRFLFFKVCVFSKNLKTNLDLLGR